MHAPEAGAQGAGHRHRVAVVVDHRQMRGAAARAVVGLIAGERFRSRSGRVDPHRQIGTVVLGSQALVGHRAEIRIATVDSAVRERDFRSLDAEVDVFEAEVFQTREVEVLPDVELSQDVGRTRLAFRNHDAVAVTVGRLESVPPAGSVFRELARGEAGAAPVVVLHDPLGERPLVEVRRPVRRDLLVRIGQILIHDDLPCAWDAIPGEVGPGKLRKARYFVLQPGDEIDDHRPRRHAPAGVLARRLECLRKAPGAVPLQHLGPAGQGSREHRRPHVPISIARRRSPLIDGEVVRREAAEIETLHFTGVGEVQHQDSVAADAREIGLVDAQYRRNGHCGVDGVAAIHEHLQSCRRGEGTGRCHGPTGTHHCRHSACRLQVLSPRRGASPVYVRAQGRFSCRTLGSPDPMSAGMDSAIIEPFRGGRPGVPISALRPVSASNYGNVTWTVAILSSRSNI